MIADFQYKR